MKTPVARGALLAVLLAHPAAGRAQGTVVAPEFDPDPFVITSDPASVALVEGARPLGSGEFAVGLALRLGGPPLQACVVDGGGSGCSTEGNLVSSRFASDLTAAYGFGRLEAHLQLPVVLFQSSDFDPPAGGGEPLGAAGIGDLRVGGKAWLLRAGAFTLGWNLAVELPTGGGKNFIGTAGLGVDNRALVDWRSGRIAIGANLGYLWRQHDAQVANLYVNDELIWSAGAEYAITPDKLTAGLGVFGRVGVVSPEMDTEGGLAGEERPTEALLSTRYWLKPSLAMEGGVGAGLGSGYGAPSFRALVGIRWLKRRPAEQPGPVVPADTDGDGIVDPDDQCVKDPEDVDKFEDSDGCPDPDNDKDKILDKADKCPDEAEVVNGIDDKDGCPDDKKDSDGDGLFDHEDKCVDKPEDKDGFQDEDGCPDDDNDGDGVADADDACRDVAGPVDNKGCPDTDRDGDTVVDRLDNCPDEPGPPDNHGCKKKQLVAIASGSIEILDTIHFDTDKARIKRRSYRLLDNIASVIAAHSEIERIDVIGHTDSIADDGFNMALSEKRAQAVVDYLAKKGVDRARLNPIGKGETEPIADNETGGGRAKNRRVEFKIVSAAAPTAPTPGPPAPGGPAPIGD